MDKVRSLKNVITAVLFKVVLLFLGIFTVRCLIIYTGNEINGLNSLFKSIVGFLSIAELGVGTAITYCMYKPIIEKDYDTVSALYKLFKKIYLIIGGIIFACGLILTPFLPLLAKDYTVDVNIYLTFILMLVSVVITYMFSAYSSLIIAYKNNYISTTISSGGMVVQQLLQIASLLIFRSFEIYLICRIVVVIAQGVITKILASKKYPEIIFNTPPQLSTDTRKKVVANVKAMFLHKMGTVLITCVGNIMISAFFGVVILGMYSNYVSIMTSMHGMLILFFLPLTSIIGHLYIESGGKALEKYFNFFYGFNYCLGAVFFLGYYAVIDDLICIFYGSNLQLATEIKLAITLNYFVQFLRQSTLVFRDATGTFYHDRWKPLIEGVVNFAISLLLVNILPEEYRVAGVVLANIITTMFICHTVEPYVLYKHALQGSPQKHYWRNYCLIAVFGALVAIFEMIKVTIDNVWLDFLANGVIAVAISIAAIVVVWITNSDFRYYVIRMIKKALHLK